MSFEVQFPAIEKVCWCDYNVLIHDLARKAASNKRGVPEQVVALGRGGFIPGVQLSHILGLPLVPLMWQTRDGHINEKYITDKHSLIVDDINDTGRTLFEFTSQCVWNNSYSVAVLYHKNSSMFNAVDYYAEVAEDEVWYEFPWER
jgi:hypoxanthine phosphoribosyltransferase